DHRQPARLPADPPLRRERRRQELAAACRRRRARARGSGGTAVRTKLRPLRARGVQLVGEGAGRGAGRRNRGGGAAVRRRWRPGVAERGARAGRRSGVGGTLLVILDQFEEYFLYRSREARGSTFADELARCVNRSDLRANFLLAIREDAYAGLGELFKGRIANVYGNYLHLEYLDRDAAREAIVKPLAFFNALHEGEQPVEIDPELVEAVLDQVTRGRIVIGEGGRGAIDPGEGGEVAIETPYLQLVMRRLWDEERAAGSRRLRRET